MIVRNSIDSSAVLDLHNDSAGLVAGAMSVTCDSSAGTFINGPVSFGSGIGTMRFGGVFKFNPLAASCIPSTLVTPISTFVIDVPYKQVAGFAKCAALVLSTLGKLA